MSTVPATPPQQLELLSYCPPVIIPQGDGSVVVKPGRPVAKLTVAQFATAVGLSPATIRRYIRSGFIESQHVEAAGCREWRILAAAVPAFVARGKELKLGGRCLCGAVASPGKFRCSGCQAAYTAALGDCRQPSV